MKKTKSFMTIFFGLSIFVLFLLGSGLVIKLINNGQATFYVQYGSKEITSFADGVVLPKGKQSIFYCKDILGNPADFSLKILPKNTFDFTVDSNIYSYGAETDLTLGFNLTLNKNSFILYIDNDFSMQDVLQALYPNKNVTVPSLDLSIKDYFSLIITSLNGDVITINFRIN